MTLVWTYKLLFLAVLLGAQIMRPRLLLRLAGWGFVVSVFLTFFIAGYWMYQQYNLWQTTELSQLFLPPHQPISYFLQYAFTHFWIGSLIAFVASLVGLFGMKLLNRHFQERFLWPAEPWLFATALLLIGHPGWIYYALTIFSAALILVIAHKLLVRTKEFRLSFYWLWLPVAIGVILISWIV
jgi:hypothetical protein